MEIRSAFWNRLPTFAGLLCLMTSLLLMPAGVHVVRAEDQPQASKNEDPMPSPSESEILQPPRAALPIPVGDVDEARQPGHPDNEIQPEFIQLNTRGYNYGPRPVESAPSPLPPRRSAE